MAASAHHIQEEAFDRAILAFKAKAKVKPKVYSEIIKTTSIEEVYRATTKLQEEQAQTGRMRHLSKIRPFLDRLNDYSQAVNVFVQVKPDVLSLIWGPIVLLLQWASVLTASFDAIIDTMTEIGQAMPEFGIATELFGDNEQIKGLLLLFFEDILDFYAAGLQFFGSPAWKMVFEALWPKQRDRIGVIAKNIAEHTKLMHRRVQFEHIQRAQAEREIALKRHEQNETNHRRQQYDSIRTKISPRNYDPELNRVRTRMCEGTGKWLLKNATFTKWLDGNNNSRRILWLQGIPGAGKTFLASTVEEETRTRGRTLFVFLSYRFTISALNVFHSLIFQLTAEDEDAQSILCESDHDRLGNDTDMACDLFTNLVSCAGPVYVIIDGLDEIDLDDSKDLTTRLTETLKICPNLRVYISSRRDADLRKALDPIADVIRIDKNNKDCIREFAKQRSRALLQTLGANDTQSAHVQTLLQPLPDKADGMFLYVKVVFATLDSVSSMDEVAEFLQVLPKDLDDAYQRILLRVNKLRGPAKAKARRLLGWIACTPTPLTLQEIQHALIVKLDDRGENYPTVFEGFQIDKICGPIVEVVDDYVQFVHFTVKEYITHSDIPGYISIGESTIDLACICVAYLCQNHHDPELTEEEVVANVKVGKYVLHDYAATTWLELVERCEHYSQNDGLINLLGRMSADRANPYYETDNYEVPASKFRRFEDLHPDIYDMLVQAYLFRHDSSLSQYSRTHDSTWMNLDPLTTSKTSRLIYSAVRLLLKCPVQNHNCNCDCGIVLRLYGERPFKCNYIHCYFRRRGFKKASELSSHHQTHDRPWKCSVLNCEYATKGFLSRRMRDDHLDHGHREEQETQTAALSSLSDSGKELPLVLDLLRAEKLEEAAALLPSLHLSRRKDIERLIDSVIEFASHDTLRSLLPLRWFDSSILIFALESAITHRKLETLELIFKQGYGRGKYAFFERVFHEASISPVLDSDAPEIYSMWEKYQDFDKVFFIFRRCISGTASSRVLRSTKAQPRRAEFLVRICKEVNLATTMNPLQRGWALARVCDLTCSIWLAKYFIDSGADINFQPHSKAFPPILRFVRGAYGQPAGNARMLKYLLLCGADPELKSSHSERIVRTEKHLTPICEYLEVSWNELVQQCQQIRERGPEAVDKSIYELLAAESSEVE